MHHRAAFSVLCLLLVLVLRRAEAQTPTVSGPAEPPSARRPTVSGPASDTPAAAPTSSPPPQPAPSTPGYTDPSTPGYGAPPAAPGAPPAWSPAPPAYALPAPAFELRDHRYTNAHVDRVILVPTAETHPAGTFYLSSYEVVVLQAGYAVSDRTQLTFTTAPPVPNEQIFPFDLSMKTVLARAPEYRIAAIGSVTGISAVEQGTLAVGRVGGVVQLCFERTCRSSVSVASDVVLIGQIIMTSGIGLVARATEHFSILLEVDSFVPAGLNIAIPGGLAIGPGVRFSGEHLALDFAFMHALDVLEGPGVPFLAATYRTAGK